MKVTLPPEDERRAEAILCAMRRQEERKQPRRLPIWVVWIVAAVIGLAVLIFIPPYLTRLAAVLKHVANPESFPGRIR